MVLNQLVHILILVCYSYATAAGNPLKYPSCDKCKIPCLAQAAAKAAQQAVNEQQSAGMQAAHQAKAQLAEKACEAQKAAEAAMVGKQEMVNNLMKAVQETDCVVQQEQQSLCQLQNTAAMSCKTLQEAKAEVALLTTALRLAEANRCNALQEMEALRQQIAEKEQLLAAACERLEILRKHIKCAKSELQCTKEACEKAQQAACQASKNIMRNRRGNKKRGTIQSNDKSLEKSVSN